MNANLITHIKAPAFEGRDIDTDLSAATLIVGEPFSGKTSIARALNCGMYGRVPELGKENDSVLMLSSDPKELFVRMSLSNGKENTLTISRDEKGATSKDFDEQVKFPTMLLDANEYLTLSGQKRLDYVLRRADFKKAGYNEYQLLHELKSEPDNKPQTKDASEKWGKEVDKSIEQRDRTKSSVYEWMESLLSRLKEGAKKCKQEIESAKVLADLVKGEKPEDVSDKIEGAKEKLRAATEAAAVSVDPQVTQWESEIQKLHDQIGDLGDDIEQAKREAEKMRRKNQCPTCKRKGQDWLKDWGAENNAAISTAEDQIKSKRVEVETIEAGVRDAKRKSERKNQAALDKAREVAQEKLDELHDAQAAYKTWVFNKERADKAKKDILAYTCELTVLKHMQASLLAEQQKLVESALNSLLKLARSFTEGLLRAPLVYKDGEFGMWRDKTWVSHEVFSGVERLLAYGGLQFALCQDSPVKIAVFDEMGIMPPKWRVRVADRMLELLKDGTIDQWVCVCYDADWLTAAQRKRISVIEIK